MGGPDRTISAPGVIELRFVVAIAGSEVELVMVDSANGIPFYLIDGGRFTFEFHTFEMKTLMNKEDR